MANVSFDLRRICTVEATNFKIIVTITAFVDVLDGNVFLFRESDDEFERVCSVEDYETYPTVSTPGTEYYRLDTATLYTDTAYEGQELKEALAQAIQVLASDLEISINEFVGDTTVTISG